MPISPLSALDMARETRQFRAFVRVMQADETLSNLGLNWQVWDGADQSMAPFTESQCPAIRLTPDYEILKLATVDQYDIALSIWVDFSVAGTNADDRLNLWGAIVAALQVENAITIGDNPDGTDTTATTVREYFRQAGAAYFYFVEPPRLYSPAQPNQPMVNQFCRARYRMSTFVPA